MRVLGYPKIEQLLRRDIEHFAQAEDHIQRNAYCSQLDGTHMAAINVEQFSQLQLCITPTFAIIRNIQSQTSVLLLIRFVHIYTPYILYAISNK